MDTLLYLIPVFFVFLVVGLIVSKSKSRKTNGLKTQYVPPLHVSLYTDPSHSYLPGNIYNPSHNRPQNQTDQYFN